MYTDYKFNHDIPLLWITLTSYMYCADTLMVEVETMNYILTLIRKVLIFLIIGETCPRNRHHLFGGTTLRKCSSSSSSFCSILWPRTRPNARHGIKREIVTPTATAKRTVTSPARRRFKRATLGTANALTMFEPVMSRANTMLLRVKKRVHARTFWVISKTPSGCGTIGGPWNFVRVAFFTPQKITVGTGRVASGRLSMEMRLKYSGRVLGCTPSRWDPIVAA